uniref:Reverse transcriptase domain-containing protein n=1 Tax=Cyprinus carpio carpio TaxID=630221 RepID=A0A9J8BQG6_CYPCA
MPLVCFFSQIPLVQPPVFHADPCVNSQPCGTSFKFRQVRSTDVQQAINKLSNSSGPGPDGLEGKFIKLASHVLAPLLAVLFNMSFDTCGVPLAWKCTKVIPLHKGGDLQILNNYRPISIINSVVKVFEKIIFNQLSDYLSVNNLLTQCQSGFRKYFSTTTALLKFSNDIFSSFDDNLCTGAIFLDLSKVFDLVDHYLLLDKLHAIGLSRSSLLWFNCFFHHRRQGVSYRGCQSDYTGIVKGIPQGSSLGPLLFSIFVNDMPLCCTDCNIHLYADDTVIYCSKPTISGINLSLQHDFNSVQQWLLANKLLLNKSKSYSLLFHRKALDIGENNLNLCFLDSSPLESTETFKYLGVWLETDLSFKTHVQVMTNKLNSRLKILYQSVNCFNFLVRKRIVLQLLMPILDYADIIYQNTTASCLHSIDVVYNSLCRFVLCCPFRTHHCVLYRHLSWFAPSAMRQYHWLQFIFKSYYLNYPVYLKQHLVLYNSLYSLRHNDQIFFVVPRVKRQVGKYAFCFKAPYDWNKLPFSIHSLTSQSFEGPSGNIFGTFVFVSSFVCLTLDLEFIGHVFIISHLYVLIFIYLLLLLLLLSSSSMFLFVFLLVLDLVQC